MARKDDTVRTKQHQDLDEVYSSRDPDLEVTVVQSIEEPEGNRKRKEVDFDFSGGVATIKTNGAVQLDREGCLRLAKAASRAAQAVA